MFRNYFAVAVRNMARNKWYTGVNVLGLAIGMAAALLIAVYIRGELAVDDWNPNARNLYRLNVRSEGPQGTRMFAMSAPAMGPYVADSLSEVTHAARLCPAPQGIFNVGDRSFAHRFYFGDANVARLFSLGLVEGQEPVLNVAGRLLISRSLAETWFGEADPLGKRVRFQNNMDLVVDGVFADMPEASHLKTDLLVSLETMNDPLIWGPGALAGWQGFNFYTYLLTRPGTDPRDLQVTLERLFQEHIPPGDETTYHAELDRVDRIYLHSEALYQSGKTGDIRNVRLFMIIAALIVLLAVINFVNLSTARSSGRGLEVGIRKTVGSSRQSLVVQFLGEATLQSVLAFVIAVTLAELALPIFRDVTGKPLDLNMIQDPAFLSGSLCVAVLIGLLAGCYPAFVLSRFNPADVLKGKSDTRGVRSGLRRTLVVVQFAGAIVLLIAAMVVMIQVQYLSRKDLGFDRRNLVYIPLQSPTIKDQVELLENALTASTDVVAVSRSSRIMGNVYSGWYLRKVGSDRRTQVTALFVGYDFLDTFGMKLAEGRTFDRGRGTDADSAFIVNREAARQLGLESPVGAQVEMPDTRSGTIIGVVENVHFQSLYRQPEPLMLTFSPGAYHRNYLAVRVVPGAMASFLDFAGTAWEGLFPGTPFDVLYQDEQLRSLYQSEQRTGHMISLFTGLSVVIGCLGLLGLAAFLAQRRSREISIRKVMGATVGGLVWMLTSDFGRLIVLANVVAWPIAWLVAGNWLSRFAYRIDIGWWIFPLAGCMTLALAWVTVAGQAWRAASINPATVLKGE